MKTLKLSLALFAITVLSGCTDSLIMILNQVELTQIAIKGDKMYLMKDFNSKSYHQVTRSLIKHPEVKTIVLTASSGSLDDETTFKLARYIRNRKLNTHLLDRSTIASGSVDLFLAGVQRTIEKGAKLGVHSWSDGSKEGKDFPPDHADHQLNANYINDMLGSDAFYWFTIYSAPADSIHWMNDAEIQKYHLITSPFLPASHDKTPFEKAFQKERLSILEN